jgi:hypothetical protein
VKDLLVPVLEKPAQAGQAHWTVVKLHGYRTEQLQLDLGYRTLIRWVHELDYHLRVPRPWPERQNEQERKEFKEFLSKLLDDPQVQLWFADESGVEGCRVALKELNNNMSNPSKAYTLRVLILCAFTLAVRLQAERVDLKRASLDLSFRNEIQHSIDRGLAWLTTNQNASGWWSSPDHPAGRSALCITFAWGSARRIPLGRELNMTEILTERFLARSYLRFSNLQIAYYQDCLH